MKIAGKQVDNLKYFLEKRRRRPNSTSRERKSELLSRVPLGSDRSAEAEDGAMHGQAEEEEQIF